MASSLLDDLGEEVTGIVAPVSLCMALTVALVRILNPDGESDRQTVLIAAAYYNEEEEDSAGKKLSGSVLNALIFIACITALTFLLLMLFKYGCVKLIYGYMGFAILNIFFFLNGAILIQLLREADLHMDAFSICFILYNFSMVGMLGLFFWPSPLLMKQGYLVIVGVSVAYMFTFIPEWTTWVLLVFMALYDIVAVLAPGGPLKALVELAIERQQDIPALVYEARPVNGQSRGWSHYHRRGRREPGSPTTSASSAGPIAEGREYDIELVAGPHSNAVEGNEASALTGSVDESDVPLFAVTAGRTSSHGGFGRQSHGGRRDSGGRSVCEGPEYAPAPLNTLSERSSNEVNGQTEDEESEEGGFGLPNSLKLGLGDFIFYSVLVGRAAFYDFMTVFAAYFAIIAGLGMTLLLLALFRRALPALPFSIALGVAFYFLTRLVLEPFIVPMTLNLSLF